jgi:hypothetical protein
MARKPQACDWCKKWRLCEEIQVVMRGRRDKMSDGTTMCQALFVRRWRLCSKCVRCCKRLLEEALEE